MTGGGVRVYGKAPAKRGDGSPLLAGLLAAFALVIAWVLLARLFHNKLGIAAWGVGGLIGIAIAKAARPPTGGTGWLAALLTLVTLVAGKIAVVTLALQPALRDEFVQDWRATSFLFRIDMIQNRSFSPNLQNTLDTRPELLRDTTFFGVGYELRSQIDSEVIDRAKNSTIEQRERLVRRHYDNPSVERFSFWALLVWSFLPWDLLWMGLGTVTSWKLGQGLI